MEIMHAYIRSLEVRGLSPQTRRTATCILTILAGHLNNSPTPTNLLDATPAHLADWQLARTRQLAKLTLRTNVSYVRCFYAWALDEDLVTADPARRLRPPKCPRLLPRPISEQHLVEAFDAAGIRMVAILALAAFAGLRAMEIAGLAWSDVVLDGAEPHARVLGKGSRERIVDLSAELVAILQALPNRRGPVIRRADGRPGHCTPNGISKALNRHLRGLDLTDTGHALRHRLITWACRHGGLRVAQEIAGHVSPTSTSGYALVADREIRAVLAAAGKIQAA